MIKRVLIAAAGVLLLGQAPAFAHAYPKTESPAKGAVVHQAPTTAWIEFDDELEPAFTSMTVTDSHGHVVSQGHSKVSPTDAHHLSVALGTMAPGKYTVRWHATDTDTHKTHGTYHFTVSK